jgi:hypothetical protein
VIRRRKFKKKIIDKFDGRAKLLKDNQIAFRERNCLKVTFYHLPDMFLSNLASNYNGIQILLCSPLLLLADRTQL